MYAYLKNHNTFSTKTDGEVEVRLDKRSTSLNEWPVDIFFSHDEAHIALSPKEAEEVARGILAVLESEVTSA